MGKLLKFIILPLLPFLIVFAVLFIGRGNTFQILDPQGIIALKERNLMLFAAIFMLSFAIPVVVITFFIAWKYRAENTTSRYTPSWTGNVFLKSLWWAILSVFVIVIGIVVWNGAHELDPYKPLDTKQTPIEIEVVALQWKWLFIYPKEHIATVNFIQFPVNVPVNFKLTADSPMNSFWIPQLSGQIYAMASMETQLHILANHIGDYQGGTSEINGSGYAGMRFIARASTQKDFDAWIDHVKKTAQVLTLSAYNILEQPSQDAPVTYYASVPDTLYNTIIMKYMPEKYQIHK